MGKCILCEEEETTCILCGELICFCPHFCHGNQSKNLRKAIKAEKLKPFTEEDAKFLLTEKNNETLH